MTDKNFNRLVELSRDITLDKKILEFLELYVILKCETRQNEQLEGIIGLKEYCEGVIQQREIREKDEELDRKYRR